MFKLFKKVQWNSVSAKNIRSGDVISDVFDGEVVHVHTWNSLGLVTIVINMPKKMFGTRITSITVPSDKKINVAQK